MNWFAFFQLHIRYAHISRVFCFVHIISSIVYSLSAAVGFILYGCFHIYSMVWKKIWHSHICVAAWGHLNWIISLEFFVWDKKKIYWNQRRIVVLRKLKKIRLIIAKKYLELFSFSDWLCLIRNRLFESLMRK